MSVSCYPYPASGNCYICFFPMDGRDTVAHEEGGEKHPVDRKCLVKWLKRRNGLGFDPSCPVCRRTILEWTLLSAYELRVLKIKKKAAEAFIGAVIGCGFLGVPLIALTPIFPIKGIPAFISAFGAATITLSAQYRPKTDTLAISAATSAGLLLGLKVTNLAGQAAGVAVAASVAAAFASAF